MKYRQYQDLKAEVLREADMEAEDFIQSNEVKAYFNDAVREACAHIQKLGLDDEYFNKSATYSLTAGDAEISLPTDIYAAKITGLTYSQPDKIYPINRIKGRNKSVVKQQLLQFPPTNPCYLYDLENIDPTTGTKLKLYPIAQETKSNCIVMDYVRTVSLVVDDTDLVDIPEFYSFVKAYVKYKLFDKENSVKAADTKADYEKETNLMLETLREITPDADNAVPMDFSHYEEHT